MARMMLMIHGWPQSLSCIGLTRETAERTDGSLRNSENWIICTDTRQTSHKTLLLKVKVSRSAIFCLAAADSLLQSANFTRNETLPGLLTTYRKCGMLALRYIITPFHHSSYVTLLVTYVMCYMKNCTESRKHNCQSLPLWIVFNCEWHIRNDYDSTFPCSWLFNENDSIFPCWWLFNENTNWFYWHQTDDIFHRINVRPQSGHYIVNCLYNVNYCNIVTDKLTTVLVFSGPRSSRERKWPRAIICGVGIFVFTGRYHDVTSPYHAAASSPDWPG